MKPLIELKNLSFSYGDLPILENVNLAIPTGQFIGIIGPNGGGKTTLIKLLMGLLSPTKGTVSLFGFSPHHLRKKIGYVPQTSQIDKDFPISVLELVLLGAISTCNFLGTYPKHIKEKALELLSQLDILSLQHTPFQELSLGQMQRAFFARALICDPILLILDEPTASVDILAEKKIFDLLHSYKKKKTIFMVSHDLNTIINKVDSILYVHRSVQFRLPQEICEHFALGLYHEPLLSLATKETR